MLDIMLDAQDSAIIKQIIFYCCKGILVFFFLWSAAVSTTWQNAQQANMELETGIPILAVCLSY